VTNYHLVAGASTVTLETPQGKTLAVAGYRAVDRARDLILLQLAEPPEDLEPLVFADPNEIRAGDEIIGVGHPEGREIKTVIGGIRMIGKTASTSAEYLAAFGRGCPRAGNRQATQCTCCIS
jgi:S1-C subfamily serine protease